MSKNKKLNTEQIKALDEIINENSIWLSKKAYSKTIVWEEETKEVQKPTKKKEINIQFTLEQVKDILEDMHFDDLHFDSRIPLEDKLEIFNHMPQLIQGDCIKWGSNDTEVRSEIGRWLVESQLDISYDEYWESEIFKEYCDTPYEEYEYKEIDLEKFYV